VPEISFSTSPQRRVFAHFPWHLLFVALAISAIGVWNLASASRSAHAPVWIQQAWFMGAGVVLALGICLFDTRTFQRLAWVFYAGANVLLVLVYVKGVKIMGARRWLDLGPFNLQPSELAKIAVALALAAWFSVDSERRKDGYGLFGLIVPMLIIALPAALTLKQPDLGTSLVIMSVGVTQILFARVRWKTLALLAGVAVVGAVLVYPHLKPYQKKRVETFLDPQKDTLGAGYHATQSIIAVGSGEGFGKGWGQGTQTYLSFLPEQHTDFAFSVWAEERGFVGCLLLLLLYAILVLSAMDIAGNARDRFGNFLGVAITGMLFWQAVVNIGMVIGVLPVVGVTLPLVSYGGTSVLTIYIGIGLLANIGMRRFVN